MERSKITYWSIFALNIILLTYIVSAAQCVESIEDAYISCGPSNLECYFGVGDNLENTTVFFTSNLVGVTEVDKIRVFICDSEDCSGERFYQEDYDNELIRDLGGGEYYIDISDSDTSEITSSFGDYYVRAIIDPDTAFDDSHLNKIVTKQIYFSKVLVPRLSCPLTATVDRETTCEILVEDSDGTTLTSFDTMIVIENAEIVDKDINEFTFIPKFEGDVYIELKVTADNYLDAYADERIFVNNPVNEHTLEIDGKDFKDIDAGIETGFHKIRLVLEKSGKPLPLNEVEGTITNPAGLETQLEFLKVEENVVEVSYNLEQPGQTYTFKAVVKPQDENEEFMVLQYNLVTQGDVTDPYSSSITWILVLAGIGALVLIITIVLIGVMVRRRK